MLAEAYRRGLWLIEAMGPASEVARVDAGIGLLRETLERCGRDLSLGRDEFVAVFLRLAESAVAPFLRGASSGVVWSLAALPADQISLPLTAQPQDLGDFLAGLFALARETVQRHPELVRRVDELLMGFGDEVFLEALPSLRLAFSPFTPREKHHIALTPDDLAALANRGLVKRAQRDLESGQGPQSLEETDSGVVTAVWPDGARATLKPDEAISDRACTCAALTVCRHTVGAVLAYQVFAAHEQRESEPNRAWDPGAISDQTLAAYWKPAVWTAIQKDWANGVVAELHRSAKPVARLHSAGVTLRFLVPDDARYVQCDCAEDSPCRHVPLAVWAFRELPIDRATGLIGVHEKLRVPGEILDEVETLVGRLFEHGLAQLPPTDLRRWEAMPARLRRQGLL